jgi:DNA-directed RNA polymerase specialized sigma24 family protein
MLRYCLSTPGGRAAYLLDRHYDDLVKRAPGACPSPVSRRTAADAVQEVLAQVARPDCAAPDRPGELFAWAVVAVRRTNARLVHDLLARAHEPLGEHVAGYSADPADVVVERSAAVERLRRALVRVAPGRSRRIAALHAFAYGRDEIAALVGATPREVRRAIDRFQLALAQELRGAEP